jgi:hypothetical protein
MSTPLEYILMRDGTYIIEKKQKGESLDEFYDRLWYIIGNYKPDISIEIIKLNRMKSKKMINAKNRNCEY